MKKLLLFSILFFISSTANAAIDFTASYDLYMTPNVSNNYDDGKGITIGIKHPIIYDLSGKLDISHISDIDFPTTVDPKGSFGELRGYGFVYNLVYDLKYDKNLTFILYAGAGPFWWDFRENPYFQDTHTTVKVDSSIVLKTGVGIEYKLRKGWKVDISAGWLDTDIHKEVKGSDGQEKELLDADHNIGLQYITYRFGIIKKF